MRKERRRRNTFLLVLAIGALIFGAAGSGLYYALRPATLRIAVGPPGSDDDKVVQALSQAFVSEGRSIRLFPVASDGSAGALALLEAGKADLAIGRGDLDMPNDIQIIATLRKNFVVLWAPSGVAARNSKKKPTAKIKEIADLAGRKIGVIGRTPANLALLQLVLAGSGVPVDRIAVAQFRVDQTEDMARDQSLDAFMTAGPLDSKITSEAIAATARLRGEPKFLAIDASEAIALRHSRYESEEIPPSVFNPNPAWPEEKIDTISVSHLIVARKTLSEAKAATFFRQLFAVRQVVARQLPGAAHITKPDTEKESELPVHRGAAAVIDGTERTFLDLYGDYFWFALLILSGIGSAGAWLRHYLNRDEREESTDHRNRILNIISQVRSAKSSEELLTMQREVDAIISDALECYDNDAIDEGELAAFCLVLDLFNHATVEKTTALQGNSPVQLAAVR